MHWFGLEEAGLVSSEDELVYRFNQSSWNGSPANTWAIPCPVYQANGQVNEERHGVPKVFVNSGTAASNRSLFSRKNCR